MPKGRRKLSCAILSFWCTVNCWNWAKLEAHFGDFLLGRQHQEV